MAKDVLKTISKLQTLYGYYGDIKDVYDKIETVEKASKLKPSDVKEIKALFGYGDHDAVIKKLIKQMDAQTKLTLEAAKGSFPDIKTDKAKAWNYWAAQVSKYGDQSRQGMSARKKYLEALMKYDSALKSRISYCNLLVKYSTKAVKMYKGLAKYAKKVETITRDLAQMPMITGSTHQSEAMSMNIAFTGLAPSATALHKAHTKLISAAKTEKNKIMKIQKENEQWIMGLQKTDLSKLLKDALAYIGVDA